MLSATDSLSVSLAKQMHLTPPLSRHHTTSDTQCSESWSSNAFLCMLIGYLVQ